MVRVTGSPKSSRAVGWQMIKSCCHAGSEELFVYLRALSELVATLPYCVADEKNGEDMEPNAPDHSADARYDYGCQSTAAFIPSQDD